MSNCKTQDGQTQAGACKNCGGCPNATPPGEVIHAYIAVVGRMNGDDEDRAKVYANMTTSQARRQFADDVFKEDGFSLPVPEGADEFLQNFEVYINHVFTSSTLIDQDD